jgi:predicted lysophospholipase L1 biosynthesis ABC-type transport system permease subunit
MNIEWTFQPSLTIIGIVVTAAIVTLVGVAGSFDVLFRKPLATLRSQ